MDCRLSFPKRLVLEAGRAARRTMTLEHKLTQLFWECTLRCNLSCRHCGSDCRKTTRTEDPPLSDLLGVLDSCPADYDRSRTLVITTSGPGGHNGGGQGDKETRIHVGNGHQRYAADP